MKNYRKHIDDFFREKLGRYAEVPPADVWDSLDARLDTLKPVAPHTPYKWLYHLGMVSLITVLSVSVVKKYVSDKSAATTNIASTSQQAATPEANTSVDAAAEAGPETKSNAAAANAATSGKAAPENSTTAGKNSLTIADAAPTGSTAQPTTQPHQKSGKQIAVVSKHVSGLNGQTNSKILASAARGRNIGGAPKNINSNIYGSSVTNNEVNNEPLQKATGSIDRPADNNINAAQPTNTAKELNPAVTSKKITAEEKKIAEKKKEVQKARPDFMRWEAGVKVGYERGFDNTAATKFVLAPYVQYNLSRKIAVMIQPAAKYANVANRTINSTSYYKENNDGAVTQTSSDMIVKVEGSVIDTYYHTKYHISQSHDSIAKSNTFGVTYMEYELPILMKYKLTQKASVYGGVNIVYSKTIGVTEHTYTKAGIVRSADTLLVTNGQPIAPAVADAIKYTGTPYSNYNGPLYPTTTENQLRLGGMIGFSYEFNKRLLLDGLIQQNPAQKNVKSGYNLNGPLSATYFRVSVGYKLTK